MKLKKVRQGGREYNLKVDDDLKGYKVAFLVESKNIMYVSPAIYSLIESDPTLVRKYLKVLRMPQKIFGGAGEPGPPIDVFSTLTEWIEELLSKNEDIMCCPKNEKEAK